MVVKIGLAAAVAALALASGTADAAKAYVSSKGEWTLNVKETKYPAGFPNIRNHVMQVTADDGKVLQYTDNFAIGDGPMQHVSLDGTFDGQPHKMSNGQNMMVTLTENGYHDQYISPNGTTGWDNCEYSKHVTVMTCHAGFIPAGSTTPVTFTEVWDKTK